MGIRARAESEEASPLPAFSALSLLCLCLEEPCFGQPGAAVGLPGLSGILAAPLASPTPLPSPDLKLLISSSLSLWGGALQFSCARSFY